MSFTSEIRSCLVALLRLALLGAAPVLRSTLCVLLGASCSLFHAGAKNGSQERPLPALPLWSRVVAFDVARYRNLAA